jgi:FkbM family methyltransferase
MSITWKDVMKFSVSENPIIFDVGGYRGDWTEVALKNYPNATIYVFEPVKEFFNGIVSRFEKNKQIKVFNFGLSDENRIENISFEQDSSSCFRGNKTLEIELKNIVDFLMENNIFKVDLIKINIEGEEFRLLKGLIQKPEITIFDNFLIQFHSFVEDSFAKREKIQKELSVFFKCKFNYDFVFEGWEKKELQDIYCIGDSHISIFSNQDKLIKENCVVSYKNFKALRYGPWLAYNLPKKIDISSLMPLKEWLLICFGEIDCRAQIHNRISENKSYASVIDEIVDNYFEVIDSIMLEKKNLIIFSIPPELKELPFWNYYKNNQNDFDCPRGSYLERKKYKEYFNLKVMQRCEKNNIKFISIYNHLMNGDMVKHQYCLDDIHLLPNSISYIIFYELAKNGFTKDEI